MAHKKAGGTASNLRDSNAQRLGIKLHDGQQAKPGAIIVRQRGTKIRAGKNVFLSKDDTLMSAGSGTVKYKKKKIKKYNGKLQQTTIVDII
ncbi:MAG: 50S ribosomal protein L27 [Candidatus Komeilibacteria bacterium]